MSGIKNRNGSVNWSKVKVNQSVSTPWGVKVNTTPVKVNLTGALEMLLTEIDRYAARIRADQCYCNSSERLWYEYEGMIEACEHILEYYESI